MYGTPTQRWSPFECYAFLLEKLVFPMVPSPIAMVAHQRGRLESSEPEHGLQIKEKAAIVHRLF